MIKVRKEGGWDRTTQIIVRKVDRKCFGDGGSLGLEQLCWKLSTQSTRHEPNIRDVGWEGWNSGASSKVSVLDDELFH